MNMEIDGWIIVIGALCACACAVPGVFLVIRGQSMLADAISHSVLPGIALGFIWSGSRTGPWMFIGAAISALLASLSTSLLERTAKVERGAAMGIVLSVFFALGLIFMVRAADAVDLDPGCVLYGAIELAPLDLTDILGYPVPRAAIVLAGVTLLNLAVLLCVFKELRIASFDPALARTLGCAPRRADFLLMAMTAVTAVACFDSIGSLLFVAMLVAPAAGARALTSSIWRMCGVAMALGSIAAALGHSSAITLPGMLHPSVKDTSSAGMMAVACVAVFLAAHALRASGGAGSPAASAH